MVVARRSGLGALGRCVASWSLRLCARGACVAPRGLCTYRLLRALGHGLCAHFAGVYSVCIFCRSCLSAIGGRSGAEAIGLVVALGGGCASAFSRADRCEGRAAGNGAFIDGIAANGRARLLAAAFVAGAVIVVVVGYVGIAIAPGRRVVIVVVEERIVIGAPSPIVAAAPKSGAAKVIIVETVVVAATPAPVSTPAPVIIEPGALPSVPTPPGTIRPVIIIDKNGYARGKDKRIVIVSIYIPGVVIVEAVNGPVEALDAGGVVVAVVVFDVLVLIVVITIGHFSLRFV